MAFWAVARLAKIIGSYSGCWAEASANLLSRAGLTSETLVTCGRQTPRG